MKTGCRSRRSCSTAGLPNPSALALASFSSSGLEFCGDQRRRTVCFSPRFSARGECGRDARPRCRRSAQLLSLNESSLALVGTLLTVTLELQSETEESSEGAAALVAATSGSAGQSLIGMFRLSEEGLEELAEIAGLPGAQVPAAAAWAQYVSGLDQAIERVGREADEQLLQEQPPQPAGGPGTSLLEQDDAAGQAGTATFVEEAALEAGRRVKAERDRLEAIDNSLCSWTKESPAALRSLLARAPAGALTRSLTPVAQNAPRERFSSTAPSLGWSNSVIAARSALPRKTIVRSSRRSAFQGWQPSRRSPRRHSWPGNACCADRSPWSPAPPPPRKKLVGRVRSGIATIRHTARTTAGLKGNECPQCS